MLSANSLSTLNLYKTKIHQDIQEHKTNLTMTEKVAFTYPT
jgi:hypothetical protein